MVEPRPTPADTPDPTPRNRVLHYLALAAIVAGVAVVVFELV